MGWRAGAAQLREHRDLPAVPVRSGGAAILLGKGVHIGVMHTLWISRMLSGLTCVAIGIAAIALAGTAAPLLFTLLLLPMSIIQMTAIGQDGPDDRAQRPGGGNIHARPGNGPQSLSLRVCRVVLVLHAAGNGEAALPDACRLRHAAGLAILAKSRCGGDNRGRRVLGLDSRCNLSRHGQRIPVAVAAGCSRSPDHAFARGPIRRSRSRFLWHHPAVLVQVAKDALKSIPHLLSSFVGEVRWGSVLFPKAYKPVAYLALLAALLASCRPNGDPRRLSPRAAAMMLVGLIATIAAIYAALYITFSTVGSRQMLGIQGRYFLPVAMLGAVIPSYFVIGERWERMRLRLLEALVAFPAISLPVLFVTVLRRFYIG